MDIKELRIISIEFRRLSSNALLTKHEEGNLHLIRLMEYICANEYVKNIIYDKIGEAKIDYLQEFVNNEYSRLSFKIPVDTGEHLKAIMDYLYDLTQEPMELHGIAADMYCGSNNLTDKVRHFIDKLIKPLINFVVDSISLDMIKIKEDEKGGLSVNQYINQNYGTANMAKGNITSSNTVNINEKKQVNDIAEELLKLLKESNIEKELKEEYQDDIETIVENINSGDPKIVKLKKASRNILKFIKSIPSTIATAELIVKNSEILVDYVQKIITTIC